jgi:hypothetical protein
VLNESSFASVFQEPESSPLHPYRLRYFPSVSSTGLYYEEFPARLKTYFTGHNDSCPGNLDDSFSTLWQTFLAAFPEALASAPSIDFDPDSALRRSNDTTFAVEVHVRDEPALFRGYSPAFFDKHLLDGFRSHSTVNTFAEADPGFEDETGISYAGYYSRFHIGVDKTDAWAIDRRSLAR